MVVLLFFFVFFFLLAADRQDTVADHQFDIFGIDARQVGFDDEGLVGFGNVNSWCPGRSLGLFCRFDNRRTEDAGTYRPSRSGLDPAELRHCFEGVLRFSWHPPIRLSNRVFIRSLNPSSDDKILNCKRYAISENPQKHGRIGENDSGFLHEICERNRTECRATMCVTEIIDFQGDRSMDNSGGKTSKTRRSPGGGCSRRAGPYVSDSKARRIKLPI